MDLFRTGGRNNAKSKDMAKERLKSVLAQDRSNVSPQLMSMMRFDMIRVLSNYIEIDEDGLDMEICRSRRSDDRLVSALVASIPIKKVKDVGRIAGY